jgi:hypothetical protein
MRSPHLPKRLTVIVVAVTALLILGAPSASAHVDGEASTPHVLVELARYAAAIAVVLAATFGVFWLRARTPGRRQP